MGPNGAGKSTLGNVLAGRDGYEVTQGSVQYLGQDLLALEPEERAAAGVFLAFQYPVEIPGVNNTYFLRAALNAQRKRRGEAELDSMQFLKLVREKLAVLHMKDELLHRAVNEGFSGGEKKRNEIFQMALLEPKLAILDETDSGLDIDALKLVAEGVNLMRAPGTRAAGDHPLPAPARLHQAGLRARAGGRTDRGKRWSGAGLAAGRAWLLLGAGADRAVSVLLESLQAGFEAMPAPSREARGLGPARREALRRTLAEGLPGQRNEHWKYTSLRALSARAFSAAAPTPSPVDAAVLAGIAGERLVFVNGRYAPELSRVTESPAIGFAPLSSALAAGSDLSGQAFEAAYERPDEAFARLNSALAMEGVLLRIAPGTRLEQPLHLVFIGVAAAGDLAIHLRHRIELGAGARATVVEHHLSTDAHRNLDNHLLQVELGAGAHLLHARVQDVADGATLLARSDARLGAGANYRRVDLELGAALSRHELNVALAGEGAAFDSSGALLAGGRRHVDTRLGVVHLARDTRCELLWRGLAAERGKLAFHGGIEIAAGADGSDASLSNKNLLLSPNAEIYTQPVLQIHADEVKAAHGATVGRLDDTALFYLRARGIPLAQARVLLTLAFCREALTAAGDAALVESLSPRLEARLATLEALA